MYLLDTNVISELRKRARADAGVLAFFAACESAELYIPVQVIGELRGGATRIRRRGDTQQADRLDRWIDTLIEEYGSQILDFDASCAQLWGWLMGFGPDSPIDKQIAAIAYSYGLIVVTRNLQHFNHPGLQAVNPFQNE